MKICMEQISLLLLLLSATYKSNIISILYMVILLTFLLNENKTTGMIIMAITFGIILSLQYLLVLLNLTSLISPYEFPLEYKNYPTLTVENPTG